MTTWVSAEEDAKFIASVWADAADIDVDALAVLLSAAQEACEAFAPAFTGETPAAYQLAVLFQARHIWSSFQGSNNQTFGADGLEVTTNTWALVLQARDLLRPKRSPLSQIVGLR